MCGYVCYVKCSVLWPWLKICMTFLRIRTLHLVWSNASLLIIRSFQKTRTRLSDLKMLWEKAQDYHSSITLAATDNDWGQGEAILLPLRRILRCRGCLQWGCGPSSGSDKQFCKSRTFCLRRYYWLYHSRRNEIILVKTAAYCTFKIFRKFSEWKNFRHTFEFLVDSNDAMSNTLKFHYLKSSITGNVSLLINRFQIPPKDYIATWNMLDGVRW